MIRSTARVSAASVRADSGRARKDSSIARAIGVAPQTLSSWRTRGIKDPPSLTTLENLADFLSVDFESVVVPAVLTDMGWINRPEEKSKNLRRGSA